MDLVKLQLAEAEALRFLATVKRLKEEHAAMGAQFKARQDKAKKKGEEGTYVGYWKQDRLTDMPRYSGAVKRASMDLSRALADMRGRNKRREW